MAVSIILTGLAAAAIGEARQLSDMRWAHRVLVVAASSPDDPELARQRSIFAAMRAAAVERDLVLVTIVGDMVTGVVDDAGTLRRRFRLPADGFAAILIGKDGGEKLRTKMPVDAGALERTIDAMPMRRAGTL